MSAQLQRFNCLHPAAAHMALQVPSEKIVERVVGRRMDPETGEIYHLQYKPPPKEIEDRLIQRSDDTEEKVGGSSSVFTRLFMDEWHTTVQQI